MYTCTYDKIIDITIQVELLIRSHDCYTLGCSVDGQLATIIN